MRQLLATVALAPALWLGPCSHTLVDTNEVTAIVTDIDQKILGGNVAVSASGFHVEVKPEPDGSAPFKLRDVRFVQYRELNGKPGYQRDEDQWVSSRGADLERPQTHASIANISNQSSTQPGLYATQWELTIETDQPGNGGNQKLTFHGNY